MNLPSKCIIFAPLVVAISGCSAAGFYAGRSIDGDSYAVDTIIVTNETDSSDSSIRRTRDRNDLAYLLENVPTPNNRVLLRAIPPQSPASIDSIEIAQVELVTRYDVGDFSGSRATLDTALVPRWPAEDKGWHGLFPGEPIVLTRTDSTLPELTGNLYRLTAKSVSLWDGKINWTIPLTAVKEISMSDGSIFSGQELCSSFDSGGAMSVPGILLARPTFPLFFPLNQVEEVRVQRLVVWGIASISLFTLGSVMDLVSIGALSSLGGHSDEERRTATTIYSVVYLAGDVIFAISQ